MVLIAEGRPGGRKAVYALLDAAGHLKDERTLRTLREAIALAGGRGDHIVLIDHSDALPAVIATLATPVTPVSLAFWVPSPASSAEPPFSSSSASRF